jgi:hypothetical protein
MVPAEGCLVDLGKGKTTALIRVLDVGEVVVEVVVRSVTAGRLGNGRGLRGRVLGRHGGFLASFPLCSPVGIKRMRLRWKMQYRVARKARSRTEKRKIRAQLNEDGVLLLNQNYERSTGGSQGCEILGRGYGSTARCTQADLSL